VTARDTLAKRRRAVVTHLALAAARELGLDAEAMRAVVAAASVAGGHEGPDATEAGDVAARLAAVAATYETLVTRAPYRPQASESEALEELRSAPAFGHDPRVAKAFENVLGRPRS